MTLNKGLFTSTRGDWKTPHAIISNLKAEFGFLYDVSDRHNGKFDALTDTWPSPWYCNPPYGRELPSWTSRMKGTGIALLPARTDTKWFHRDILPNAEEIRFVQQRIHFDVRGPAPFPSMVVVFGFKQPTETRIEGFEQEHSQGNHYKQTIDRDKEVYIVEGTANASLRKGSCSRCGQPFSVYGLGAALENPAPFMGQGHKNKDSKGGV